MRRDGGRYTARAKAATAAAANDRSWRMLWKNDFGGVREEL